MYPFLNLLDNILTNGTVRKNERTGYKTYSLFGPQIEYDLSKGLPLLTTRKLTLRPVVAELLWFLSGSTNSRDLNKLGAKVWDQWALTPEDFVHSHVETDKGGLLRRFFSYIFGSTEDELTSQVFKVGDLGPIYGEMWRAWPGPEGETFDQIEYVLEQLRTDPYSRRIIVSGWNPAYLPNETLSAQQNVLHGKQALAPCHTLFQFFAEPLTREEKLKAYGISISDDDKSEALEHLLQTGPQQKLSCKLYARSQDVPIGTAFNQAMYPILVHMICKQMNMLPGRYIHSIGDAHIYENQVGRVKEQLKRTPGQRPTLTLKGDVGKSIFSYQVSDFGLENYNPQPVIKFPIAI